MSLPSRKFLRRKGGDPYLVLIGTLLSLRTKDETTEMVMRKLTERARTPEELLKIPDDELQKLIYPVGFYRNKSHTLKSVSEIILSKYNGMVPPDSIDELLTIKGSREKNRQSCPYRRFPQTRHLCRHSCPQDLKQAGHRCDKTSP